MPSLWWHLDVWKYRSKQWTNVGTNVNVVRFTPCPTIAAKENKLPATSNAWYFHLQVWIRIPRNHHGSTVFIIFLLSASSTGRDTDLRNMRLMCQGWLRLPGAPPPLENIWKHGRKPRLPVPESRVYWMYCVYWQIRMTGKAKSADVHAVMKLCHDLCCKQKTETNWASSYISICHMSWYVIMQRDTACSYIIPSTPCTHYP